jgi:acyl-CoA thioester hydrolase
MRAPLDIEMWAGAVGGASIDVCYEIFSPVGVEPRVLYTRAATTVVMVSAATNSPTRVPAELRDAWKPYIEEPVAFGKRR